MAQGAGVGAGTDAVVVGRDDPGDAAEAVGQSFTLSPGMSTAADAVGGAMGKTAGSCCAFRYLRPASRNATPKDAAATRSAFATSMGCRASSVASTGSAVTKPTITHASMA